MGWVLLLLGALLMVVAARRSAWEETPVAAGLAGLPLRLQEEAIAAPGLAPWQEELGALRADVGELVETMAELALRVQAMEARPPSRSRPASTRPAGFGEVLESSRRDDMNEAIWEAHREGKDITEIARQFGRGKGEVELILNLRR